MKNNPHQVTKYYLDEASYNNLLQKIQELNLELRKLNLQRGEVYKRGTDNNWDGIEFVNLEENINFIKEEIKRNQIIVNSAVIIESKNIDGTVDIGNILRLNMIFSEDDSEEIIGKLVGFANNVNKGNDYEEISINSPVGSAIYRKNIGERISYKVDGKTYYVEILEQLNLEQKKTKTRKK